VCDLAIEVRKIEKYVGGQLGPIQYTARTGILTLRPCATSPRRQDQIEAMPYSLFIKKAYTGIDEKLARKS
jgi:hypothetical protein